ncbi:MAG: secondary thiamine-phosphate synthase enzyme YjbQ [Spirochaetia bacterium]
METLSVQTGSQTEFKNITKQVQSIVKDKGIQEGMCTVYIPHTTAGVTINEAADPAVKKDIVKELNKIVPFQDNYAHMEGNSAAHIKASLTGISVSIPITGGNLALGTWQGIYFCEYDGPRSRKVHITILPE